MERKRVEAIFSLQNYVCPYQKRHVRSGLERSAWTRQVAPETGVNQIRVLSRVIMFNLKPLYICVVVKNRQTQLLISFRWCENSSAVHYYSLVAVHMIKEILALNKPAYVGLCMLDLYKTLMYDFQYNYIKPTVSVCQYYWQTLTVELMKLKLKMCIKTFEKQR